MGADIKQITRLIKARISSRDLVEAMGFPVNRFGRMDFCPVCGHKAKPGSGGFIANPLNKHGGSYYCEYTHHGGDIITLCQEVNGLSFRDALQWLNDTFALNLPEIPDQSKADIKRASERQRMRNAWFVLYELSVALFDRVMKDSRTEYVHDSNNLLDDVKSMIDAVNAL